MLLHGPEVLVLFDKLLFIGNGQVGADLAQDPGIWMMSVYGPISLAVGGHNLLLFIWLGSLSASRSLSITLVGKARRGSPGLTFFTNRWTIG